MNVFKTERPLETSAIESCELRVFSCVCFVLLTVKWLSKFGENAPTFSVCSSGIFPSSWVSPAEARHTLKITHRRHKATVCAFAGPTTMPSYTHTVEFQFEHKF